MRDTSGNVKQRTVSSDVRADFEAALRSYGLDNARANQIKPRIVTSDVRAEFEKCVKKHYGS